MSQSVFRPVVLAAIAATISMCAAPGTGLASGRPATLSAPVIHEPFTPLPCTGAPNARNTLQQEGCAEHRILTTDAQINTLAASIFAALADRPARQRFITAQRAWLAYRRADCLSVSDIFEGGTQAAVLDAQCSVGRNEQRIKDLRTFRSGLTPTG